MKMTKKQVQKAIKGLKSGLSMSLAIILLTNTALPLQAKAMDHGENGAAEAYETAENGSIPEPVIVTVQEKLMEVCEANEKITNVEKCAKHLLGMVMTESEAIATAVGDRGYSHGWFQIHSYYNPEVTRECAQDLECSATWTLKRLISKGYPRSANWAIWCHNGCGINQYYVPKVLRKAAYHWDKPITIVTADEIRQLALK